jgi:hypothetical protein
MTTTLTELAQAARCIDDTDWGSSRQVEAENAFFDAVRPRLSQRQWDDLEAYCLKATHDERIDRALELVGDRS